MGDRNYYTIASYDVSKLEYKKIAARRRPPISALCLIGGAENVGVLVHIHLLQLFTGRSEIFARIEFGRVVVKTSRTIAVIAKRPSLSMLILHTELLAALRSCSSGIPTESFSFPPYLLIFFTYSCGTEEDPCRTIGNPGSRFQSLPGYRSEAGEE